MKVSYVYVLRCSDKTYYTGITNNLDKRLFRHNIGFYRGCYTYARRPLELSFYCEFPDITIALDKERQLKRWPQSKKEMLIKGDYEELLNLKND